MKFSDKEQFLLGSKSSAQHNFIKITSSVVSEPFNPFYNIDGQCELYAYDSIPFFEGAQEGVKKRSARKSDKYENLLNRLQAGDNFRNYRFDKVVDINLEALAKDMPNYRPVIDMVESAICLARKSNEPLSLTPILLDGGPGIGKSHFANRLAEALSVPILAHDMASASNAGSLAGTDAHWSNAEPGDVLATLVNSDHISPVFVLDELDKAPAQGNTLPRSALYSLLEPENSRRFSDRCLPVTVNASHAVWIATTNDAIGVIEPPLLSRFQHFAIEPPTEAQRYNLAKSFIKVALDKLRIGEITVDPLVLERLATLSPRSQKQCVRILLGQMIKYENNSLTLDIWPDYLRATVSDDETDFDGIGFLARL